MTPLSLRGFGRLVGADAKSVRNGRKAGVFSEGSLRLDDKGRPVIVDTALAIQEWERSGRKLRGTRRPGEQRTPATTEAHAPNFTEQAPSDPRAEIDALLARVRSLREGLVDSPAGADAADAAPLNSETSPTLVKAQTEAMLERGRKLRMENDLRQGTLLEADQAAREAFNFARTLRETFLNLPARIAPELAAESDAGRVFRRLDAAIREALEATVAVLERAPSQPAGQGA